MKALLTGGAGYIGSHTFVALKEAGHEPVILDNFANANRNVISRLEKLVQSQVIYEVADIRDRQAMIAAFKKHQPEAVIHFAGAKAVDESVKNPAKYFDINVTGTQTLLDAMDHCDIRKLIFSSTAAVYGNPDILPVSEDYPLQATNTYGETKVIIEEKLRNLHSVDPRWAITILRYFNAVGAHPSGKIGEDPTGDPTNLMAIVSQVAIGRIEKLNIYGGDYNTPDGTGVRDYIHVCDLAAGHQAALALTNSSGCEAINLGTGKKVSVLELINAFEKVSGRKIPYTIIARRKGDIAESWTVPVHAKTLLDWEAKRDLEMMCADCWRWQSENPNGYEKLDQD